MDYELELKVRNAPLLNRMREAGYHTAADLSRASGVTQSIIGRLLAMKLSLYTEHKNGAITVRPAIKSLADFLVCTPEEIYPQAHWYDGLGRSIFVAQVSREQFNQLTHKSTGDPMAFLEFMEEQEPGDIESMITHHALSPRETKVLRCRFVEDLSLEETAKRFDVSRERIRQMEQKALRKLRNPDSGLREYIED